MKNIHILPTDKPSRLSILNSGKLNFGAEFISSSNSKAQHIYITSDEEIKEGDYIFETDTNKVNIADKDYYINEFDFKIILTTDQDLIKDGVQAIDDEFIQWFVKNPSCEEVEIYLVELCDNCGQQYCDNSNCRGYKDEKFYLISTSENTTERVVTYCDGYEVKEEPKQHVEFINNNIEEFDESLKSFKQKQYLIDMMRGDEELGLYNEPKQETIEEAAERLVNRPYGNVVSKSSFIEGAEYQAERMYSEEEVRKLLETQRGNCYVAILTKTKDKELAAIAGGAPEPSGYNGWVK
jgi:hypothetical protein